jgi:CPA2 family monovalent cation:H+ antiporter-2
VDSAPILLEIALVLLGAAAAGWAARRIGLPAVVGYLLVGLAVSPFTPGYVADRQELQLLADLGVVLLLFEVGIEIDIGRLRREHGALLWAAPLQTLLTSALAAVPLLLMGLALVPALVIGLAVGLSSSVVVVNITRSRRRTTDRPTEQALLGWAVLQDVTGVAAAAVLFAFLQPDARPVEIALLGALAFVVVAIAAARLLPRVLVGLRQEHDLFLILSVAGGLALAALGSVVFGLPLALAAFVAGLVITDSPDTAEIRRRLLPFRDVFAVLFFVAIGTLVDPSLLPGSVHWIGALLASLLLGKTLLIYVLARAGRVSGRPAQLAVGLSQVGEFSFVLASVALGAGAIPVELYGAILVVVVLSIAISAVAVRSRLLIPVSARTA